MILAIDNIIIYFYGECVNDIAQVQYYIVFLRLDFSPFD